MSASPSTRAGADRRRRACLAWLACWPWLARAQTLPKAFIFVVHPFDTPSRVFERFRPLTLYLAGAVERPMLLRIAATYEEQVTMIADGMAQFAYLGPTPYVAARQRAPIEIIAGETDNGRAFYQSVIVVRADSDIRALHDLRGRTLALGAEMSMGSSVAPKVMLAQAGVRLDELGGVTHVERHERVALSVLHGDFDAGGLRLDIARPYLARGLRVIATSQPLPPHVIAAAPGLPPALVRKARMALLYPDDTGLAALRALGEHIGFTAIDDGQFHAVRTMLRALPGKAP